ncbi:MAG TPA: hypothetical protein VHF22_00735, partial [Planctomycetota bacterium]|nr:hypothetical protein [Planctomycetota bacterium]
MIAAALLLATAVAMNVNDWSASTWASATLDAAGAPAALRDDGRGGIAVPVRFTGQGYEQGFAGCWWTGSFAGEASISVDVTLPAGAPAGLRAQIVLFLGPSAAWTAGPAATSLAPGATTTVRLPLAGGLDPAPLRSALADVRGFGVKIDASQVAWTGEVALDAARLAELDPPAPEDLAVRSVGVFGGYVRSGKADVPLRDGFLAFSANAAAARHALVWPKLGANGGDFFLGGARYAGAPLWGDGSFRFLDWTALEASQSLWFDGSRATPLLSRAFPAVRYRSDASSFTWASGDSAEGRAPAARLAV